MSVHVPMMKPTTSSLRPGLFEIEFIFNTNIHHPHINKLLVVIPPGLQNRTVHIVSSILFAIAIVVPLLHHGCTFNVLIR